MRVLAGMLSDTLLRAPTQVTKLTRHWSSCAFSIALNGSAGSVDSRTRSTFLRLTYVIGFGYFEH